MDIVHGPMGMYSIGSTKNVRFINGPYNKTAAAEGQFHEDSVVSYKNAVEQPGNGKGFSEWFLHTSVLIQV